MALKPCKECKHEISTTAKRCPNCGAKNKRQVSRFTAFLVIGFALLVFWSAAQQGPSNSPIATQPTEQSVKLTNEQIADKCMKEAGIPNTSESEHI